MAQGARAGGHGAGHRRCWGWERRSGEAAGQQRKVICRETGDKTVETAAYTPAPASHTDPCHPPLGPGAHEGRCRLGRVESHAGARERARPHQELSRGEGGDNPLDLPGLRAGLWQEQTHSWSEVSWPDELLWTQTAPGSTRGHSMILSNPQWSSTSHQRHHACLLPWAWV